MAEELLPPDGWGALSVMKARMESRRFCTRWGAGLAVPLERSKSMPMNTKRLDGTRSHLARLTTRPSCLERLRSQEVQAVQAGAVGVEMFQSSRYWSSERPWPLAKAAHCFD